MTIAIRLSLFSLLFASHAWAECGFVIADDGITIVVGKESNRCFQSEEFRARFREQLVGAVTTMDAQASIEARRGQAFDDRTRSAQKLWGFAEREHASKRYFGQK